MTQGGADIAPPCVETRGIAHVYRAADGSEVHALDDVSIEIPRRGFASLIGESGCGKSTLLKIIGGLLEPTEGEAYINGEPVEGPEQDSGYMFQDATLLPWRTAEANVLLPIEIRHGRKRAKASVGRARELLAQTGIGPFAEAYPHQLSGGMAQRVAICRMLVTEPTLLLLDEPFGALDELTRETMNEDMQSMCAHSGAAAIMVTHSIPEAVFLSDVVYVMSSRPGRIVDTIEINLPRPRDFETTTSQPEYLEDVRRVRHALTTGSGGSPTGDTDGRYH